MTRPPMVIRIFERPDVSGMPLPVAAKRTHEVIQPDQGEGQNKYSGYADQIIHIAASKLPSKNAVVQSNPASSG